MKLIVLFVVFSLFSNSYGDLRHYDGYKVYRLNDADENVRSQIENMEESGELDIWLNIRNEHMDVMVSPGKDEIFSKFLENLQIPHNVMIGDLEVLFENERKVNAKSPKDQMDWNSYHDLNTIYKWMDDLELQYPELVDVQEMGSSFEGRVLKTLRITKPGTGPKKAFWIDGTIHAREWISTSTVTYIINHILTNQDLYSDILDKIEFYFFPIINPDGYDYTHKTDRMWRKTRQPAPNSTCIGTDANRNFEFHFGGEGSSGDPCSETYRGTEAYSEPEAFAVKNFIEIYEFLFGTEWTTFVTVHSYGQLFLTPWGYTRDLPDDYDQLKSVADRGAEEIAKRNGTIFRVGSSANILYPSSGSSRDWSKGLGGFKYSYTLELRDEGRYGFVLPPDQIIDTAEEVLGAIWVICQQMLVDIQQNIK